ncbi:SDR family NAD(P)-dependent oxidoreductase [Pararhodobacter oceanensis]|uniref:SDR family NAD(P)-dependent oxidoreductase n=1 Tax=Pararhodobacter oceanensis TaxID=2172121 RepID=UPI003A8F4A3E
MTGASSGIGRAIVRSLLLEGYMVTGVDRLEAPVHSQGYEHLICDLSTAQGITIAVNQLRVKSVQALVCAAGVMRSDAAEDARDTFGAALWMLHVAGPQRLAEALKPNMPEQVGRIAFLSSRASQGRAGRGLYAASKAGCEALVRSLALELLPRGITVNAVAPGPVATAQTLDPARADAPVALPPIGRMIAAQEVASTVVFLLSAQAGAITGQTLMQCGGLSLMPPQPSHARIKGEDHAKI